MSKEYVFLSLTIIDQQIISERRLDKINHLKTHIKRKLDSKSIKVVH